MANAPEEKQKSNISTTTWILVFIVCVVFDFISLVPVLGDIEDIPGAVIFVVNMALGGSGILLIIQGIVMALKAIPGSQELPWWTMGAIVALATEKIPALRPALKVAEKAGELEGGGVEGELGEAGVAAESQAESAESAQSATGAESNAEDNGVNKSAPENATADHERENQQESSTQEGLNDERGRGDAIGDLQEDIFEGPEDNLEPQAKTPFRNDIEAPQSSEKKGMRLVKGGSEAARDGIKNFQPNSNRGENEEEDSDYQLPNAA